MEQSLEQLKRIMLDYDYFLYIAEKLEWLDVEEQYEEWRHHYPLNMLLEVYKFPQDYDILHHMADVYVRVVFSSMAHYEEWEPGYWDVSREERRQRLKAEYMLYWYEQYATFAELRLRRRDWTHLANEIKSFAVENDVLPFSYQKQYLDSFENAKVIELGGYYAGDATYWAIKHNTLLVVSCGFWD